MGVEDAGGDLGIPVLVVGLVGLLVVAAGVAGLAIGFFLWHR